MAMLVDKTSTSGRSADTPRVSHQYETEEQHKNSSYFDTVEDLAELSYLNEHAVLRCLETRYMYEGLWCLFVCLFVSLWQGSTLSFTMLLERLCVVLFKERERERVVLILILICTLVNE